MAIAPSFGEQCRDVIGPKRQGACCGAAHPVRHLSRLPHGADRHIGRDLGAQAHGRRSPDRRRRTAGGGRFLQRRLCELFADRRHAGGSLRAAARADRGLRAVRLGLGRERLRAGAGPPHCRPRGFGPGRRALGADVARDPRRRISRRAAARARDRILGRMQRARLRIGSHDRRLARRVRRLAQHLPDDRAGERIGARPRLDVGSGVERSRGTPPRSAGTESLGSSRSVR